MAPTKPKTIPDAKLMIAASTKVKFMPKVKPTPKKKPKQPSQKTPAKHKTRVSKTKTKTRRFKSSIFWGLPTEIRQHIISYAYTDRDMEKSIRRRWGEARFVFGSHYFDTEDLMNRTLLLMDVEPKVKKELEFVRNRWLKRGGELAKAMGNGK